MNPYKEAIVGLEGAKTMEAAIIALEAKAEEDADYIHMNIEMLTETINVLLKLKGQLQKQANE